jgi:hypothetical protein
MHDDPFARAVERVEQAEQSEQQSKRRRRREQLERGSRKGFRIHASVYVATNLLLVMIWASTAIFGGAFIFPWFIYPLLGWGIGLAAHYAAVSDHLRKHND